MECENIEVFFAENKLRKEEALPHTLCFELRPLEKCHRYARQGIRRNRNYFGSWLLHYSRFTLVLQLRISPHVLPNSTQETHKQTNEQTGINIYEIPHTCIQSTDRYQHGLDLVLCCK